MINLTNNQVHRYATQALVKTADWEPNLGRKYFGVPRGGIPIAYLLAGMTDGKLVDTAEEADIIVDDIIDSGATRLRYPGKKFIALVSREIVPSAVVAAGQTVAGAHLNDWVVFPWEQSPEQSIEDACTRLLQFIGEDPTREGLQETPTRMARAWQQWTEGYRQDPAAVFKTFADGGEDYNEMIVIDPIPFYSHCEHHMAAIFGDVHIGYIPNGRIAGLSKFARLVDVFARRLQVQERLTVQIANTIQEELKPLGCAVYIKARHFCMESRGVSKSGIYTKTSAMRGIFLTKPEVRAEFMGLIK